MSNLRTWLARIESELSKPVVYDICDDQEIQKRLAEQQVGNSSSQSKWAKMLLITIGPGLKSPVSFL